jgi:hypothetical protein
MSKPSGMTDAINTDKKPTGRATFKKLVCPFDLDAIFSL